MHLELRLRTVLVQLLPIHPTHRRRRGTQVLLQRGDDLSRSELPRRWLVPVVLTSNDPQYREKLAKIQSILSTLGSNERFFSIDEYGPFAVKMQGGRSLMPPGRLRTVPQRQKSKGRLILTAALELSTNQVSHFYSEKKNTAEMIKLLDVLLVQYASCDKIYFSWDAASWHASKALYKRVDEINSPAHKLQHRRPLVELVPLPSCAQFLNVIESVFSGMAKAIIHNSDYESLNACMTAIDRYYLERNEFFKVNPKRAGKLIWGKERVPSKFSPSNNCKDPKHSYFGI
jgi:DDE superfamily endonuclease